MYDILRTELRDFYGPNGGRQCTNPERLAQTAALSSKLDAYALAHPEADAIALREQIYRLLAQEFQPRLFPHSPFYGLTGGNGGYNFSSLGRWLYNHNVPTISGLNPDRWKIFSRRAGELYYLCCGPYFDEEHNSPPISNILRHGFRFYYEQAQETLPRCQTPEETAWVQCAIEGLRAVHTILGKYAAAARTALAAAPDDDSRHCLQRIVESAPVAPWEPPRTFYEGLNTLWFVREFMGELEGLVITSLGHPDAWLNGLYEADLAAGRLTRPEAYDLVCRFLLQSDCSYDHDIPVTGYGDHENEMPLTLGGCDESGAPVFNEVTRMFLQAHHELHCIYPKLHCRFSAASPAEYLKLIAEDLYSGHCVYSLFNDDGILPALLKDGKTLADARSYACTGCWDLAVDSCEDNTGGNYFSLARVLEATIHDTDEQLQAVRLPLRRLDSAASFEEVYQLLMANALLVMRQMMETERDGGSIWPRISPAPLNSACSNDCLRNRRDFTAGGQRYNPHAVSLCFWANYLDSLQAIRTLCFESRVCTLPELLAAVRSNWQHAEPLRQQVLACPHWGDNRPETRELARRVFQDFYDHTRDLTNEKGGHYQLGIWIYREFRFWGEKTKALPDGRRSGEYLAQSLNPSHFRNREPITTILQCLACLDSAQLAGNSVVNLVLNRQGLTPDLIVALLRSFAALKLQLLQLNVASREELLDAQKHPEAHQDLIVRICGFSAKFTALSPEWQQEILQRKEYQS